MALWEDVAKSIERATGMPYSVKRKQSIGGGCINQTYRVSNGSQEYFVKLNDADKLSMFEAEMQGLQEIYDSDSVRVPEPLIAKSSGSQAFLVMEFIPMGGGSSAGLLGEQLAQMHQTTSDSFGWSIDNTIGSTKQPNKKGNDWTTFWREQRLGFQLQLAASAGYDGQLQTLGEKLMDKLPVIFADYTPKASLLHGDLWGGNYSTDYSGNPVIYDPATYYGDRETDIAMTELFGGFEADFYRTYNEALPLEDGYSLRKQVYNLYHVLNHLNLFGGGYGAQAEGVMERVLAEV